MLVTVDQNLRFQQNLENYMIAVLVLKAGRSTYSQLKPLVPKALEELERIKAGNIVIVAE